MDTEMTVAFCVLTTARAERILGLLESVSALEVPAGVNAWLLLVVNTAEPVELDVSAVRNMAVRVVHEPRVGLASARNRAVAETRGSDLLVFQDDDERPRPDSLARLVEAYQSSGADVVQGSSTPAFPSDVPQWALDLRLYSRHFAPGLVAIPPFMARTSNVLIRRDSLPSDSPFDPALNSTGSEDTHLFRQMADAGARFVAVDEACVDEPIPADRVSARWWIRRGYQIGWGVSYHLWASNPSWWRRIRRLGRGLKEISGSVGLAAMGMFDGNATVRAGYRGAYGAGLVAGAFGSRFAPRPYGGKIEGGRRRG
ncbi:MAG: glycosyltransferase family 2 protein [Acidimicrobiales bacterium]